MKLRRYVDADYPLTVALETDPATMRELGGPRAESDLPPVHRRRVEDPWYLTIEEDGEPVGAIGIWTAELDGEPIHETGWMVLPAHQGRGLASAALAELLERARAEPSIERIHAFPGVTNVPSNALCQKFGFTALGERDGEFAGRPLRVRHWVLSV